MINGQASRLLHRVLKNVPTSFFVKLCQVWRVEKTLYNYNNFFNTCNLVNQQQWVYYFCPEAKSPFEMFFYLRITVETIGLHSLFPFTFAPFLRLVQPLNFYFSVFALFPSSYYSFFGGGSIDLQSYKMLF